MRRTVFRRAQSGLTLIELMVALSIFAVLGVLSYRALSVAGSSQTRLDENFRRWNALARSINRLESELFEIPTAKAQAGGQTANVLQLTAGAVGSNGDLDFLRLDAGRGVRRAGFRLRDEKLEWLLWDGREAVGKPQVEILLDQVRGLRWRFMADGQRLDAWPPDPSRRGSVPAAIIVDLELSDLGSYQRIFALR